SKAVRYPLTLPKRRMQKNAINTNSAAWRFNTGWGIDHWPNGFVERKRRPVNSSSITGRSTVSIGGGRGGCGGRPQLDDETIAVILSIPPGVVAEFNCAFAVEEDEELDGKHEGLPDTILKFPTTDSSGEVTAV